MEAAINFIKISHKEYKGKVNNDYLDNEGNNYEYYKNLIINPLNEINNINEEVIKLNKIINKKNINKKSIYIPEITNKNVNKISYVSRYNNENIIFNYKCNYLNEISIFGNFNIIFNITLPNLKKLECSNVFFNAYQPIEKLIFCNKYYFKKIYSNIMNNFNDLLIKLPNLKYISFIDYYYELENNNWNITILTHKKYDTTILLDNLTNININTIRIKRPINRFFKLEIDNLEKENIFLLKILHTKFLKVFANNKHKFKTSKGFNNFKNEFEIDDNHKNIIQTINFFIYMYDNGYIFDADDEYYYFKRNN